MFRIIEIYFPLMLVFSTKILHPGSQMHPAYEFMLVVMDIRIDYMAQLTHPNRTIHVQD